MRAYEYSDEDGKEDDVILDTQRDAYEDIQESAATMRATVVDVLRKFPDGLTVHEAAAETGIKIPSIQPRFSELRSAGLIADSAERRVNIVSGKRAAVWVLVVA